MTELKPCPYHQDDFFKCRCHFELFTTLEEPPRNIRIKCATHSYVLKGSYSSVDEAIKAWNRRANDGN